MLLYPEQVILDHEVCQEAHNYFSSYEFDQSDLALDVIADVGPGSHFLMQKHTREHIRDFRLSPILYQKGEDGRELSPQETALAEFRRIEKTHQPEPLPQEELIELDRILTAADKEAEGIG
jgi:trimethylamine--corrinoid protein Co-methyltransferase